MTAPVFLELELKPVPRSEVERVSARLFAAGASGLQEDWLPGETPAPRQPWDSGPPAPEPDRVVLRAWFEAPDCAAVEAAVAAGVPSVRWVEVEDVDWEEAWRKSFAPIRVGDGLVVAPPWDAPEGSLVIEPGQGFGTGQHPSTLQALRHLLALPDGAGHTALDVGCGSGILAIAAARFGYAITGIDVEEAAIRDADRNAARNGVSGRFSTTPIHALRGVWDLVFANLHAELLVSLAPELARVTSGRLIVAGILADREDPVHAVLLAQGLVREAYVHDGEWVSAVYRRS